MEEPEGNLSAKCRRRSKHPHNEWHLFLRWDEWEEKVYLARLSESTLPRHVTSAPHSEVCVRRGDSSISRDVEGI